MHYSNIRSRAGLVALFFALIISLVSAVPIPTTESGLSSTLPLRGNPSLNGQDHHDIQLDTAKISLSGRMSTLPAATRALTRGQPEHISTDTDDQHVRRNFFSGIEHAFEKVGGAIKKGVRKIGGAVKKGVHKVRGAIKKIGGAIKKGVHKVRGAIKKIGGAIKKGVKKVGHVIKNVAHKVGKVVKKVGHAIKTAASKARHFIKTDGAQIAEVGLKIVQTGGEAVGKASAFIPGVGLPVGEAMDGVSSVAGSISDRINVKLPSNWQKGMDVMNKADQIMNYIPKRREFIEEEAFQQRDISETYYLEERDDVALENREESYLEVNERDIWDGDTYNY